MHSIAETYAALTRLPVQPRIHPSEAGRIIHENILKHFTPVPAGEAEYLQALAAVQDSGWARGEDLRRPVAGLRRALGSRTHLHLQLGRLPRLGTHRTAGTHLFAMKLAVIGAVQPNAGQRECTGSKLILSFEPTARANFSMVRVDGLLRPASMRATLLCVAVPHPNTGANNLLASASSSPSRPAQSFN